MGKKNLITEDSKRSIAKAITFRILVIAANGLIVFAITREYTITLGVVGITSLSSTLLYFFHERAWNAVSWDRRNKK